MKIFQNRIKVLFQLNYFNINSKIQEFNIFFSLKNDRMCAPKNANRSLTYYKYS